MKQVRLAVAFLYDDNKILLQDRKGISKTGEDWALFGGSIEAGESPEVAIVRELREELEYSPKTLHRLGKYITRSKQAGTFSLEVFLSRVTPQECDGMVQHEGSAKEWFTYEEAVRLNFGILQEDAQKIFADAFRWMREHG